jgi:hypothetical protein
VASAARPNLIPVRLPRCDVPHSLGIDEVLGDELLRLPSGVELLGRKLVQLVCRQGCHWACPNSGQGLTRKQLGNGVESNPGGAVLVQLEDVRRDRLAARMPLTSLPID